MKIALAQINPRVGDLDGNRARCGRFVDEAQRRGAQLVVFPELALSGYPPKDLLDRDRFVAQNRLALMTFAASVYKIGVVVGFIDHDPHERTERRIYNAAATIKNGQIVSVHHKSVIPAAESVDEARHFTPGARVRTVIIDGRTLGISVGADLFGTPEIDPLATLTQGGADVLVNIAALPFTLGQRAERAAMVADVARRWQRPLIFVNQVGGNDELVFDGHSVAFDADGEVLARARELAEDLVVVDIESDTGEIHELAPSDEAAALDALALGVRDYVVKSGFSQVVVGLSGGIDSSLTAAIAVRALGPENVHGVAMPSRFSSLESEADAKALADNLGIHFETVDIEPVHAEVLRTLAPAFGGAPPDVAEENVQARLRGLVLMALANKRGHLVLNTGNKSELWVGYCTLYGDMVGGLSVLGDVPKTMVYRLAAEINREGEVIPAPVFEKPPSAELRHGQTDQDSLPPYEVLDPILEAHLEEDLDETALVAGGFDPAVVASVLQMVRQSEHKRRQAPPVLRITSSPFAPARKMPLVSGWRG